MATSNDHPGLPFVQAQGYTRGRPDGPPLWIVVHDMEASEYSGRAESTAAYFANPGDGRSVSSHYCVDDNSTVQCVDLDDVAWTVGNRPGNNRGINWELSGFARQNRAEWLDAFGLAMFRQMAPIVRSDSARFKIPLRRCTIAELRAYTRGVTSHNDLRLAFGVTDHTDPGPNFPWDVFLSMMQGGAPTKKRSKGMNFFSIGASQYAADPTFERYWTFASYAQWLAIRRASGYTDADGNTPAVTQADLDAGLFGRFEGVWVVPRKPPAPVFNAALPPEQIALVNLSAKNGAKEGVEEGNRTDEELIELVRLGSNKAEDS